MGSGIARAVTSVARPVSGGSTSFPTSGFGSVFGGGGGLGQLFSQVISPVNQQPTAPVTLPVTPTTPMSPIRRFNAVVDPKLSRTMSRPMFRPSRYDGQINQLLERLIPNSSISRPGIESMLPSTPREVPVNIPTPPPSFSIQDYLNSSFSKRPTMGTMALVPITLPTGETYNLRSGGDASNFRDFLQSIGRNPQDIENIFRRNELAMARGGRVNYQDGGQTKTPPKFIPMDLESVAFRLFKDNLDNLTYNQKQTVYDYIEQNRNKKANGGRMAYANEGILMGSSLTGKPFGISDADLQKNYTLASPPGTFFPIYERKMGLFTNPDGSYPGENMPNSIQALPRPGMPTTQIQSPSQTESIREALMSLPQTRSNPRMSAMRKLNQVQDPRMIRLMQMLRRQPAAMGGIMNLKMGGTPVEMDLRAKGGFVPIGKKERADDVPARLSKNEFVFTAKAVRNAGGGDIREGARKMYNLMNKLEAKR